ncbi:RRP44A [Scenedesmus sp. PABB004]|nr:RRP44A [Scenedesmus sp. PABB004]
MADHRAQLYDAVGQIWLELFGEHVHVAYYPDTATRAKATWQEAQLAHVDAVLEFAGVKKAARLLDLGCGYGGTAVHVAQRLKCKAVGINISPFQARRGGGHRARRGAARRGAPAATARGTARGTARRGRAQAPRACDRAGRRHGVRRRFVAQLSRLCAPGGTVVLVDFCRRPGPVSEPLRARLARMDRIFATPGNWTSAEEYQQLMGSSGLSVVRDGNWTRQVCGFWNVGMWALLTRNANPGQSWLSWYGEFSRRCAVCLWLFLVGGRAVLGMGLGYLLGSQKRVVQGGLDSGALEYHRSVAPLRSKETARARAPPAPRLRAPRRARDCSRARAAASAMDHHRASILLRKKLSSSRATHTTAEEQYQREQELLAAKARRLAGAEERLLAALYPDAAHVRARQAEVLQLQEQQLAAQAEAREREARLEAQASSRRARESAASAEAAGGAARPWATATLNAYATDRDERDARKQFAAELAAENLALMAERAAQRAAAAAAEADAERAALASGSRNYWNLGAASSDRRWIAPEHRHLHPTGPRAAQPPPAAGRGVVAPPWATHGDGAAGALRGGEERRQQQQQQQQQEQSASKQAPPQQNTKKSFVKKTRGGKVVKVVREHYLRDDIWSGSPLDPGCDPSAHKLSPDAPHYLVIDTNVALHQMDFLEHPAVNDVIVCRTVVEEVRRLQRRQRRQRRGRPRASAATAAPAPAGAGGPETRAPQVEHRNRAGGQRLKALCQSATKRFYVFSNEHHKCAPRRPRRARRSRLRGRAAGAAAEPPRRGVAWRRDTYVKEEPGESPNDRNDRAIRVAAKWYAERLPGMRIILLTNDAGNLAAAAAAGLVGMSLPAYARSRAAEAPELQDLVARQEFMDDDEAALAAEGGAAPAGADGARGGPAGPGPGSSRAAAALAAAVGAAGGKPGGGGGGGGGGPRGAKRARVYEQHRPMSDVAAGIASGRYHQGALRVSRFSPFEGWVASEAVGQDIMITGRSDMNRAMDGDVVAVELLPEAQWRAPSRTLPGAGASGAGGAAAPDSPGGEEAGDEAELAPEIFQVGGDTDLEGPVPAAGAAGADGRRPTGRVVGIIRRNWRSRGYCGSLKPQDLGPGSSTQALLFVPVDRRYPMIRIHTRQGAALMDKRLVVAIDGWDTDSMYPAGHYVRTLGLIGDRDVETDVLLIENDINTAPFSPAVHECVPPLPWAVTEADVADPNREDLRHLCVCSVDPPGCMDIDDALHVRELANGNLEVGVHIADVTHFLAPGTAMDAEAASRATTTYLVQRRIDMLPKPLTEDICSLRGGVERLAFSALWEMTRGAEVVSVRFTKSVIASRAALTYAEAQARIDDERLTDDVTKGLRHLLALSKLLKQRRLDAGALSLASPEVKFKIDTETHNPLDVGMYQTLETNSMVEELMLLANVAVATAITARFPSCSLLRRHQTPAPRQFEPLLAAAGCAGFALDVSSSKALAGSLDAAVRPDDAYFNKLVRIMATRCMTQAQYFGSGEVGAPEYHHYGLASPIYTHFTSPIRRYADVVVHRLLAATLGIAPLPDAVRDSDALHDCAGNLNTRHRNAQMAGRASVELHTLIFFKDRPVLADARVVKVKANGLVVFVPKFGIEGPVYLVPKDAANNSNQAPPAYALDESGQALVSADGATRFAVFDKVAVRIEVEEGAAHRRSLALALVPRDELPPGDVAGRTAPRKRSSLAARLKPWTSFGSSTSTSDGVGARDALKARAKSFYKRWSNGRRIKNSASGSSLASGASLEFDLGSTSSTSVDGSGGGAAARASDDSSVGAECEVKVSVGGALKPAKAAAKPAAPTARTAHATSPTAEPAAQRGAAPAAKPAPKPATKPAAPTTHAAPRRATGALGVSRVAEEYALRDACQPLEGGAGPCGPGCRTVFENNFWGMAAIKMSPHLAPCCVAARRRFMAASEEAAAAARARRHATAGAAPGAGRAAPRSAPGGSAGAGAAAVRAAREAAAERRRADAKALLPARAWRVAIDATDLDKRVEPVLQYKAEIMAACEATRWAVLARAVAGFTGRSLNAYEGVLGGHARWRAEAAELTMTLEALDAVAQVHLDTTLEGQRQVLAWNEQLALARVLKAGLLAGGNKRCAGPAGLRVKCDGVAAEVQLGKLVQLREDDLARRGAAASELTINAARDRDAVAAALRPLGVHNLARGLQVAAVHIADLRARIEARRQLLIALGQERGVWEEIIAEAQDRVAKLDAWRHRELMAHGPAPEMWAAPRGCSGQGSSCKRTKF